MVLDLNNISLTNFKACLENIRNSVEGFCRQSYVIQAEFPKCQLLAGRMEDPSRETLP
jgi:hypothetical protein